MTDAPVFGLLARFETARALTGAASAARQAGYRGLDAFSPFPVPGLDHALGLRRSRVTVYSLIAGVVFAAGAFFMQWYSAVVDYPFVVGGKPLSSWPAFLLVTFEAGILATVLTALFGMLAGNGLPRPYHPVFNSTGFERASGDGFFLLVPVSEDGADVGEIRRFLVEQEAAEVEEIAP